ncbi:hypothetical protein WKW77_26325 [Variovorax ureilyticus]|uniref:Lipoprotein n=1 Tax=Variovorax ureilyticus TaxID=1836198 RepID=A0ABU8VLS7_9BURK
MGTAVLFASLFLVGCDGSDVKAAKSLKTPNKNYTLGEMLDMRKFCDVEWSTSTNDRGDKLVQMSCKWKLKGDDIQTAKANLRQRILELQGTKRSELLIISPKSDSEVQAAQRFLKLHKDDIDRLADKVTRLEASAPDPSQGQQRVTSYQLELEAVQGALERERAAIPKLEEQVEFEKTQLVIAAQAPELLKPMLDEAGKVDLAAMEKELESPTFEQRLTYMVDGDRVSRETLQWFFNGKRFTPDWRMGLFSGTELDSPKSDKVTPEWNKYWAANVPFNLAALGAVDPRCALKRKECRSAAS